MNLTTGPGGYWWFSLAHGWRQLDAGIGNANGPAIVSIGGERTLIFGDTLAQVVYAYPYDPDGGAVGPRRVHADYTSIGGAPDGATADTAGGIWSCVLPGRIAHLTPTGIERVIDLPVPNPSDVAFGGPLLDRLFLTSIALDLGRGAPTDQAGSLLMLEDLGVEGMPEHRFKLR